MRNPPENEQRLFLLERELRRMKTGLYLATSLLFLFVVMGLSNVSKEMNTVVAHRFVLVDDNNQIRAELGTGSNRPNLPFFSLYDDKGEMRVSITVMEDQSVAMAFMDASGHAGIGMGLNPQGLANLSLMDASGNVRCRMNLTGKGESKLTLMNGMQTRAVNLTVSDQGHGELEFAGGTTQSLARLQVTSGNIPGLFFSDGVELRAALGILSTKDVSILLMDREGKMVFQAPQ